MNSTHPLPGSGRLPRCLVAEDDPSTRQALVALLERNRYEVITADNGQAAVETLVSPDPPSIALLDWEMPRLDGLHVCRAVRTLAGKGYAYVIMLTARDAADDVLTAFAAGVDDFLPKPIDAGQLLARLRCGERVLGLEERCSARIRELEQALDEVRQLKRLLPICMYCKKVRDDGDYWQEIDAYLHARTGTDFSHGICPTCLDAVLRGEAPDDPVARAARAESASRQGGESGL